MDKTFALQILENMWFVWITMAALEFFSRKKICKGRQNHKRSSDHEECGGLVKLKAHSNSVAGVWNEMVLLAMHDS